MKPAPPPPARGSEWMLEVEGLTKTIGTQEILRGINFRAAHGETVVVIGRSGGGKSVMLKHIIGLHQPTSGKIWIEGTEISGLGERQLGPHRKRVGMLFQDGALFDSMSVAENIAFPLRESGMKDPAQIREKVTRVLGLVELDGQENKMPVNLSGGMRKRVGLARAIVTEPCCVLYDEPTSGLDPVVSDSINHLIRRLQAEIGVTSVVVTHDMKSAFAIADRISYLHQGRIYFDGSPEDLRASRDPLIVNFVEGTSVENDWRGDI